VHGLVNKKAEDFRSPEEEDAALVARIKNRPDTEWLSEHKVVEAFQRVVEGLESRDNKL
jgi:salicylate hydroxylase